MKGLMLCIAWLACAYAAHQEAQICITSAVNLPPSDHWPQKPAPEAWVKVEVGGRSICETQQVCKLAARRMAPPTGAAVHYLRKGAVAHLRVQLPPGQRGGPARRVTLPPRSTPTPRHPRRSRTRSRPRGNTAATSAARTSTAGTGSRCLTRTTPARRRTTSARPASRYNAAPPLASCRTTHPPRRPFSWTCAYPPSQRVFTSHPTHHPLSWAHVHAYHS